MNYVYHFSWIWIYKMYFYLTVKHVLPGFSTVTKRHRTVHAKLYQINKISFKKLKWMFYMKESEKRRRGKIDSWNTTNSSEAFRHICRRPVLLAMNSTCATVVGRDPLIMAWLYSMVTFSLLSDVLTTVVTLFLN